MQLRTRIDGGGTQALDRWGVDSEYGTLRDVLIGPIDHFTWQPGNSVCQRAERVALIRWWRCGKSSLRRQLLDGLRNQAVTLKCRAQGPMMSVIET